MDRARAVLRQTGEPVGAMLLGVVLVIVLVPVLLAFHGAHGQLGQSIPLFFLIPVLVASVAGGRIPGTLVAVLALFAWDWFFIPPYYRVTVASVRDVTALAVFLVVAVLTGQLATRLRVNARQSTQRAGTAEAMYGLSVALLARRHVSETLHAIAVGVQQTFDLDGCAVLLPGDDTSWKTVSIAGRVPDRFRAELSRDVSACAGWAAGHGTVAEFGDSGGQSGTTARRAETGRVRFLPLRSPDQGGGVLELVLKPAARLTEAEDRLLSTLANGMSVALEQDRLAAEEREAAIARESDQLKSILLSSVSHDLRTPLTGIKAAVSSLLQKDITWSEADREAFLTDIDAEVDRLSRLVSNILDVSRIEAGVLRPHKDWENVRDLVQRTIQRSNFILTGHEIEIELPNHIRPVKIDTVEIEQVLANLLENAVRYSPPAAPVGIVARDVNGTVEIAVSDRGPGIPAHLRDRVFDKFYRATSGPPQRAGTGMGLAIVKGFVEAHGGSVRVEDREGGGSTFVVALPAPEPGPVEEPAAMSEAVGST